MQVEQAIIFTENYRPEGAYTAASAYYVAPHKIWRFFGGGSQKMFCLQLKIIQSANMAYTISKSSNSGWTGHGIATL